MILVVGTPAAYLLATRSFRGRAVVLTLIELPADPAARGRRHRPARRARARTGIIGPALDDARHPAAAHDRRRRGRARVRGEPVLPPPGDGRVRRARSDAARGLAARSAPPSRGRSRAWPSRSRCPSLATGAALAWGRALGEFGATLMFAGSFRGVTQTAPLAIFELLGTDFDASLALAAVLVAVSAALLLVAEAASGPRRCASLLSVDARVPLRDFELASRSTCPRDASRSPAPRAPARPRVLRIVRRPRAARVRGASRCDGEVWTDTAAGVWVAARAAPLRLSLPGLRALPAPERLAQRRLRPARGVPGGPRRRAAEALLERFGVAHLAELAPGDALGRRAPAGGARPHARPRPEGVCCSTSRSRRWTRRTRAAAARELGKALREAAVPALLVTHDFAEAALLGDEVAVIDRGRLVQRGGAARARRPAGVRVRGGLPRRERAGRNRPAGAGGAHDGRSSTAAAR